MRGLLIDTAFSVGFVSLVDGETLPFSAELPTLREHSRMLMPTIVDAFKTTGWGVHELDFIAFGVGPGSYTGIRLAKVTAEGLAYPHQIPLRGICSLEAYRMGQGAFAAADAKSGGVYILAPFEFEPKLIANQEFNEVGMTIQTPSAEPLKEKFPHVNWLATPPDIRRFAKLAETQEEGTTKLHYLR